MLLTFEQIKSEIAAGAITAISLDTSIFENSQNRFEHAPLSQLRQFAGSRIRFLVTDVVAGEVKAHVARDGKEAESAVKAALRKTGEKWQVSRQAREAVMVGLLGGETPEAMSERRFKAFTDMTGLSVVTSEPLVSVTKILEDYFSANAPFGTNAVKKNEFPDAIALNALQAWALSQKTKVLVVSKDNDWKSFCAKSPVLVMVEELGDALSLFHQDATVACYQLSLSIQDKKLLLDDEVWPALQAAAEQLDFNPEADTAYYYEQDVESVVVEGFEFLPIQQSGVLFKPVDHDEQYLVAEALARVTVSITTSFSFSVWDSIDRDEVPMGASSVTKTFELTAKLFVTFEGDLTAPTVVSAEAEFEGRRHDLDYGSVSPDWQDYEE